MVDAAVFDDLIDIAGKFVGRPVGAARRIDFGGRFRVGIVGGKAVRLLVRQGQSKVRVEQLGNLPGRFVRCVFKLVYPFIGAVFSDFFGDASER